MKFFIDTAEIEEIKKAKELGLLDGVTTNPSLIAKSGRDFKEVITEICALVDGPVSAEAVADTAEGFIEQGIELAKIAKNVVVKLPLTTEGLKACKALSDQGIDVNMTLCFQTTQALMAAKAGARFISPFIGRLDDISQNGMQLIEEILHIYDTYGFETEVLAASIRHPLHLQQASLAGAHIATIPYSVIPKLLSHPLTDKGNAQFIEDFKKFA